MLVAPPVFKFVTQTFVTGLAAAARGAAIDVWTLYAATVLMGFGVGCTLPTATRAMQYWVQTSQRGFAQGFRARERTWYGFHS